MSPRTTSHHVVAEFPCRDGQGSAFLAMLLPALADTRAHEGCERIETYTDDTNPDLVILWQEWATREHQQAYIAWRATTGMSEAVAKFVDLDQVRVVHLNAQD